MAKDFPQPERVQGSVQNVALGLPRPTPRFRRSSWLAFQRALDPLARPKPLPQPGALSPRVRPPPSGG